MDVKDGKGCKYFFILVAIDEKHKIYKFFSKPKYYLKS